MELLDDSAERDYGIVSVAQATLDGKKIQCRILWPDDTEILKAGSLVIVSGSLTLASDSDGGRWNHQNAYVGMVSASSVEDAGYANSLRGQMAPFRNQAFERLSSLEEEIAAILTGVVIADKTLYKGTVLEQNFQTTGLAHLMAVSGTHLAVVVMLLMLLLGILPIPRWARTLILAFFLIAYVVLTGFSPSAIRAAVMSVAGFGAGLALRRKDALNALALAVIAFLAITPAMAFSTSFQLSALAVFGLITLSPLMVASLDLLLAQRDQGLNDGSAAAGRTNLTTAPITIPMFAMLPLITPLASPVCEPFMSGGLIFGILGIVALHIPVVGNFLCTFFLAAASFFTWILIRLVKFFAALPFSCVPVDSGYVFLGALIVISVGALIILWPLPPERNMEAAQSANDFNPGGGTKVKLRHAIPCAILLLIQLFILLANGLNSTSAIINIGENRVNSSAQIIMLDVGQGDSVLIRDGTSAILIDTGEEGDVLLRALARQGVSNLDAVILTHKDSDHTGALSSLMGVVTVSHVYIHADLLDYSGEYAVLTAAAQVSENGSAEGVRPGTQLTVGNFTLTVLAPEDGGESENEDSLISLLEYDADADGTPEVRALLTGDAEENEVAEVYQAVGDVDIVKVGHHGSKGAFNEEELEVLKPEIALIGVGADNTYGHPTQETLSLLEAANATVFRTDTMGDITLNLTATQISISTQNTE